MTWEIHSANELARYGLDWDRLNAARGGLPFLSTAFLLPLLREFGAGRELLALHRTRDATDAVALLAPRGGGMWQTYQPSQLPLGAWLAADTLELEPLLQNLLQRLPGFALGIGLTQQDPLLARRPDESARLRTLDYIETAWVEVGGDFNAYWNARGKNLRQNMRKQRSKLEADGIAPRLAIISEPNEVAEAIAAYGRLESAGWKASGGTAIHPDNAQGRFYRNMLEAFCARGEGRIYCYRFNEKVVAVDLCVLGAGKLVILKTTYDESHKALSPAFLMRQEAFEKIFDEGAVRRIEFYGKRMEWHTRWTEHARALYHVTFYRWPFLPKAKAWMTRLRERAPESVTEPAPGT